MFFNIVLCSEKGLSEIKRSSWHLVSGELLISHSLTINKDDIDFRKLCPVMKYHVVPSESKYSVDCHQDVQAHFPMLVVDEDNPALLVIDGNDDLLLEGVLHPLVGVGVL